MAHVVRGAIAAHDRHPGRARPRKRRALREDRVEDDVRARIALAEDAEVAGQLVRKRPARLAIEEHGEPHRRRGEGMRRPADPLFAEALLEDARHEREKGAAAHDIEPRNVAPKDRAAAFRAGEEGLDGLQRALDERRARGVDLVGGKDERLLADRREIHEHAPRVRAEALLLTHALLEQEGPGFAGGRAGERAGGGPVEDEAEDRLVEIVAAEPPDAVRRHDLVRLPRHPEERGVERASPEVVDDEVLALRIGAPVTVRVLEARGRRLVEERLHRKAAGLERLERQEALGRRRVRGHGHGGVERFVGRQPCVRSLDELTVERGEKARS